MLLDAANITITSITAYAVADACATDALAARANANKLMTESMKAELEGRIMDAASLKAQAALAKGKAAELTELADQNHKYARSCSTFAHGLLTALKNG